MAKVNVIFNRPVRLGKKIYPKSKRSVEVDEKDLLSAFAVQKLADGSIVKPQAPVAKAAPAKADK